MQLISCLVDDETLQILSSVTSQQGFNEPVGDTCSKILKVVAQSVMSGQPVSFSAGPSNTSFINLGGGVTIPMIEQSDGSIRIGQ